MRTEFSIHVQSLYTHAQMTDCEIDEQHSKGDMKSEMCIIFVNFQVILHFGWNIQILYLKDFFLNACND